MMDAVEGVRAVEGDGVHTHTHDLHSARRIIGMIKSSMRWAGHVARMGERRVAYRVLVGRPERRRPLRRSRRN